MCTRDGNETLEMPASGTARVESCSLQHRRQRVSARHGAVAVTHWAFFNPRNHRRLMKLPYSVDVTKRSLRGSPVESSRLA